MDEIDWFLNWIWMELIEFTIVHEHDIWIKLEFIMMNLNMDGLAWIEIGLESKQMKYPNKYWMKQSRDISDCGWTKN